MVFFSIKMSFFNYFFIDTFLLDFVIVICVLIDFFSSSSFTILSINLHAFEEVKHIW